MTEDRRQNERRADVDVSLKTMQFGGNHYKGLGIEPIQYAVANQLGPCEFSAIKYVTRHDKKGRDTDIKKAMHYCAMILSMQYGITVKMEFSDDPPKSGGTPLMEQTYRRFDPNVTGAIDGASDECKATSQQVH